LLAIFQHLFSDFPKLSSFRFTLNSSHSSRLDSATLSSNL
jgi:hypothetical protein